jgi:hypothetical protein
MLLPALDCTCQAWLTQQHREEVEKFVILFHLQLTTVPNHSLFVFVPEGKVAEHLLVPRFVPTPRPPQGNTDAIITASTSYLKGLASYVTSAAPCVLLSIINRINFVFSASAPDEREADYRSTEGLNALHMISKPQT